MSGIFIEIILPSDRLVFVRAEDNMGHEVDHHAGREMLPVVLVVLLGTVDKLFSQIS